MKYSVGIDLGGTNIGAGIVSEYGELVYNTSVPVEDSSDCGKLTRQIAGAVDACRTESGIDSISFVGIGVPGVSRGERGPVVLAPNINWKEFDLVPEIERLTGLDVIIGNDADCAAIGEYRNGIGKNYGSFLMLTLGTGVGGAYFQGGKLFLFGKYGGEFGHIPVVHGGVRCNCGKCGCFEVYASANALKRETREEALKDPDSLIWEMTGGDLANIKGRTAFDAAEQGDACGQRIVDMYISYLADGISGLCNIFRPDIVILGGGVANQGDTLFDPLNGLFGTLCYAHENIEVPKIVPASLGNKAGIIGAGLLGF